MLTNSQWLSFYRRFTRLGHLALGYTGSSAKIYQKVLKRKFLDRSRLDNLIAEIQAQQNTANRGIETFSPLIKKDKLLEETEVGTDHLSSVSKTKNFNQLSPQIEKLVQQRLERTIQFMVNAAFSSLKLRQEKENYSEELKKYLKTRNKTSSSETIIEEKSLQPPRISIKEAFEFKLLGKLIQIEKSNHRKIKPKKYNPAGETQKKKSNEENDWSVYLLNYIVSEFNKTMDLWL